MARRAQSVVDWQFRWLLADDVEQREQATSGPSSADYRVPSPLFSSCGGALIRPRHRGLIANSWPRPDSIWSLPWREMPCGDHVIVSHGLSQASSHSLLLHPK